jgi:hypothetical protein
MTEKQQIDIGEAGEAEARIEKEKRLQERLDLICQARSDDEKHREKDKQEKSLDAYVEVLSAHLPSELKIKVQATIDRMRKYGVSETDLKNETEIEAREVFDAYVDGFGMLNKSYEKMVIRDLLDNIFKNKPKIEDLKKVARISWDLNALGAVNDLNGGKHDKGDSYIKICVKVLTDPAVLALAKKFDLELTPFHESGDEFAAIVVSREPIVEGSKAALGIKEIMRVVHDKIYRDQTANEILDVSDKNVKKRLSPAIRKAVESCPEKPVFHAWMSGAVATLYEAMMGDNSEKNIIKKEDGYLEMLSRPMGSLFDFSDVCQKEKKERENQALMISSNPNDRFLFSIFDKKNEGKRLKEQVIFAYIKLESVQRDLLALYREGAAQSDIAAKEKEAEEVQKNLREVLY